MIGTFKWLYFCIVIITLTVGCKNNASEGVNTSSEVWVQLFNGKDLSNWKVKIRGHMMNDNFKNTFRVVDGVLQVNYDEYDEFKDSFGHLFYDKKFTNYRLRLEYRFTGDQLPDGAGWATRNSGVMLHCQKPETMGLNQTFPVCVEGQFLGGLDDGPRSTGNLCTPGTNVVIENELVTNHCISSNSETYNGDQWVQAEFLVMNDSIIKHIINGKTVLTYNKPQLGNGGIDGIEQDKWDVPDGTPLTSGYIALQSESHPVEFRKIEILEMNQKN